MFLQGCAVNFADDDYRDVGLRVLSTKEYCLCDTLDAVGDEESDETKFWDIRVRCQGRKKVSIRCRRRREVVRFHMDFFRERYVAASSLLLMFLF